MASLPSDPHSRRTIVSLIILASLICGLYLIRTAFFAHDFKMPQRSEMELKDAGKCKNQCRPQGTEVLPEGILAKTSDLEMRPLWGMDPDNNHSSDPVSLLAIAAGIKQKYLVDKIITKFLKHGFVVMMFHYDGIVDQWDDLQWASRVIHISAANQTKWWFAKRFLHPDIVAEYDYVFLWDEDLDIEHFDPSRYISIVKEEKLDISQPALDPVKSEIHHQITVLRRNSKVHRRYYKLRGGGRCYGNSTGPPCLGWVEMMAPVFSKATWRCSWYLIQNDLIHGWGIDFQLGYCAQGDRKQKVGVVDAEYIVHLGVPSLGGSNHASKVSLTNDVTAKNSTIDSNKSKLQFWSLWLARYCTFGPTFQNFARLVLWLAKSCSFGPSARYREGIPLNPPHVLRTRGHFGLFPYPLDQKCNIVPTTGTKTSNSSDIPAADERSEVRRQSYIEMQVFWRRWNRAVENDKCWVDRYAN